MATVLLNDFPNTGRSTSFETTSFDYWATPPPPYSPPASRIRVDQHLDGPRAGDIHHSVGLFTLPMHTMILHPQYVPRSVDILVNGVARVPFSHSDSSWGPFLSSLPYISLPISS